MNRRAGLLRFSRLLRERLHLLSGRADPCSDQGVLAKPNALFVQALAKARVGDLSEAATLLEGALTLSPSFADAWEKHGEVLDMAGKSELARAKYKAARALRVQGRGGAPDRPFVFRQRGNFTLAILEYTAVAKRLKNKALPYIARGNAYLADGQAACALADYDRVLRLEPNGTEVQALRAEVLSMLGRYREALKAFDVALKARADDRDCLSGRAIARLGLGEVEAANADWRRQLELLPPERSSARACVALRLADYHAALPDLEQALLKEPSDPYWRLYRLTARRRLDRPAEPVDGALAEAWPGPLIALHAGRLADEEVLGRADMEGRRIEALFQLGVVAFARDREAAVRRWQEVVRDGAPSLIEYAAASNELSRLGS